VSESRRLAAIVAADVVGFSRMTGADEDRTLARLRALRSDLIDPTVAVHNGRVFKRTGDGALIEFRSVVDAVRCAVEVQNAMVERNAGVSPERRIEFRVGIHLGDVVEEADGDLMGDGVNIAARLEGIAQPGAICLSEDAFRQVKARLELAVSDLGITQLKNIAEPVHVYSLGVGPPAKPKLAIQSQSKAPAKKPRGPFRLVIAGALVCIALLAGVYAWRSGLASRITGAPSVEDKLASAPHLSMVVMPFTNLSGDPGQDYFAEGVTENLTTALSQLRGSFVIAHSTASTFKGKNVDAREIGKELGVRYVLSGSVQRDGQQVRVNAELIDADKGGQLWAESFTDGIADIFRLQDDIVAQLARALQVELLHAESGRVLREGGQNPDAVDLAMRGWSLMFRTPSKQNNAAARDLFEKALAVDAKFPDALAGLAYADMRGHINGWSEPGVDGAGRAMKEAEQAIALDPNYAYAYYIKADLLAYGMKPGDERVGNEALAAIETAIRINPSFASGYYVSAIIEVNLGRYEEAISHIQQAIRLSPRDFLIGPWLMWMGRAHFGLRQYDAAIQAELKSIDSGYRSFQTYIALAAAYAAKGNDLDARNAIEAARQANPKVSVDWLHSNVPILADSPPGMLAALRKAGLPEE
jgi:adenylate cyclase